MPVQILPALERFIAAAHAVETLFLSRWKSSSQEELSLPLDAPLQVSTRPCSERRVPRHSGYTGGQRAMRTRLCYITRATLTRRVASLSRGAGCQG